MYRKCLSLKDVLNNPFVHGHCRLRGVPLTKGVYAYAAIQSQILILILILIYFGG